MIRAGAHSCLPSQWWVFIFSSKIALLKKKTREQKKNFFLTRNGICGGNKLVLRCHLWDSRAKCRGDENVAGPESLQEAEMGGR